MLRYTEICENWVSKVAKYRGCRGRARQMRYQMEPLVPAVQCSGVRTLFCEGGVEGGSSQSMLRYTEICENWVSKVAKYRGCRGRARQMRYLYNGTFGTCCTMFRGKDTFLRMFRGGRG